MSELLIACTGDEGTVGKALVRRGVVPIVGDITKPEIMKSEITHINPDIVIHCAALTSVDACENDPKEAFEVNTKGTANVLQALEKYGKPDARFILLSSDHVFDGKKFWNEGYSEYHSNVPVNMYGMTKLAAESIVRKALVPTMVVRTSKLFNYKMVLADLLDLGNGDTKEYTNLIQRSFLHVEHFVDELLHVAENGHIWRENILHVSGDMVVSYYDLWTWIAKEFGISENLIHPRNHELKDEAPRPFRGGLSVRLAKKYGVPIKDFHDGISLMLREEI